MDPAAKNQSYIDAYYKSNQAHLQWSFWASLTALATGLVVLVVGLYLAMSGAGNALSAVTTAAGVLTQFISAGFFFLYSKNLKQLNVFYEKLIKNQDTLLAYSMVGHIQEQDRPAIIKGIIGALLSRSGPSTEITPDLIRAMAESAKATIQP